VTFGCVRNVSLPVIFAVNASTWTESMCVFQRHVTSPGAVSSVAANSCLRALGAAPLSRRDSRDICVFMLSAAAFNRREVDQAVPVSDQICIRSTALFLEKVTISQDRCCCCASELMF